MATKDEAALGCKVRDIITGCEGVIIAKTDWINGCHRITVQPLILKDGRPADGITFDVQQVIVFSPPLEGLALPAPSTKMPGGPFAEPVNMQDPTLS